MGFEIIKLEREHWSTVREIYVEGLRTGQATFETSAELNTWLIVWRTCSTRTANCRLQQ